MTVADLVGGDAAAQQTASVFTTCVNRPRADHVRRDNPVAGRPLPSSDTRRLSACPSPTPLSPMRTFLTLALLALALPACDGYNLGYDDGYDDGQNDRPQVRVVDFEFDRNGYQLSNDERTATFESDDITSNSARTALQDALATAGDGAVVVAYVESSLIFNATTTGQTYSALPVTRAFRDTVEGTPYETVLSYEYSFDNGDFYFDVVSSDPDSDFGESGLFAIVIPRDPQLRVVTIPADVFNKTTVDLTNYAEVRAAFNLPD